MKYFLVLVVWFLFLPALASSEDYVIGDGDGLDISVWAEPALSTKVTVRPDGKITLPAIGDVAASGYTPVELSEKLTDKLNNFVKKPIVTVSVGTITNNRIYVFGGGVPGGVTQLTSRTSLLKFMIKYGSFKGVNLESAYILRNGKKLDANFHDLLVNGNISKDIMLMPEDILYIPDNDANKIYVIGAVNKPTYIPFRDGLKILDAILEAGGFNKNANENSVMIMRKDGAVTKDVRVKAKDLISDGDLSQNVLLRPGDFIIVKESIF